MVRIGTFNVENLFARYRFRDKFEPSKHDGFLINDQAFNLYKEDEKKITAKAIKAMSADILALQEVESLAVLDRFNSKFLGTKGYKYRVLIDGFDRRKIDVALLSNYPITHVRTYRHERNSKNNGWLFSRDCLEVDLDVNGKTLRVYVNHFKSMVGGRERTKYKRKEQVAKVAEILKEQWGERDYEGNFIVLGDFNDYFGKGSALYKLLRHPGLVDVSKRIPKEDRWTHFWNGGKEYRQLDYLLLSKSLAKANPGVPEIIRQGLPLRAEEYTGERFKGIGKDTPKASDHCPVVMEVELI